jgi:hypothetical protein
MISTLQAVDRGAAAMTAYPHEILRDGLDINTAIPVYNEARGACGVPSSATAVLNELPQL